MRYLLLLTACCLSFSVSALIITEKNNVLVYPTPSATFEGTPYTPGIDSCWIPYGTYSRKSSLEREHTRVTSNLTGVVYSVLDGYFERFGVATDVIGNDYDATRYFNEKWLLIGTLDSTDYYNVSYGFVKQYIDKNKSARIIDLFNRFSFRYYYRIRDHKDGSYDLETTTCSYGFEPLIEDSFAYPYLGVGTTGILPVYSSRNLEAVVGGSSEPPVENNWTHSLPFKAADADTWAYVWPVYGVLTNDIHFFRSAPTGDSWSFGNWMTIGPPASIWGEDVNRGANDLLTALRSKALPYTVEDVLSLDTGWRYEYPSRLTNDYWTVNGVRLERSEIRGEWDDLEHAIDAIWRSEGSDPASHLAWDPTLGLRWYYWTQGAAQSKMVYAPPDAQELDFGEGIVAKKTEFYTHVVDDYSHWHNGSTRLDWKRLGILCQLERQMEITYRPRYEEDYLRYISKSGTRLQEERTTYDFDGSIDSAGFDDGYYKTISIRSVSGWGPYSSSVSVVTNDTGWSFPTARGGTTGLSGQVSADSIVAGPNICLPQDVFRDLVSTCMAYQEIPDGSYEFRSPLVMGGSSPLGMLVSLPDGSLYSTGGQYIMLTNSATTVRATATYSSSRPVIFHRTLRKSAASLWTYIDSAAMRTNMVAYPCTNIWDKGYVNTQSRPTLEVMLVAEGYRANPYIGNVDEMTWDSINAGTTMRSFRMNPRNRDANSHTGSDLIRIEMLRDLNDDVLQRAGRMDNIEERTQFNNNEEQKVKDNLDGKQIKAMLSINVINGGTITNGPYAAAMLFIKANLTVSNGSITSFVPVEIYAPDSTFTESPDAQGSFFLGTPIWTFEMASSDAVDYDQNNIAVDGHQNQMIKTLWKFKNLRDPGL